MTPEQREALKALRAKLKAEAQLAVNSPVAVAAPERVENAVDETVTTATTVDGLPAEEVLKVVREELADFRAEAEAAREAQRAASVPGSAGGSKEKYSFGRALLAQKLGRPELAPYEYEVHQEALKHRDNEECYRRNGGVVFENLAQGTTPDASGGILIPREVRNDLYVELPRTKNVVQEMGAGSISLSYPTQIPTERTYAGAGNVPENQAAQETSVEFGQINARPHSIETFIKSSNQLLAQAEAAETLIRRSIVKGMNKKRGQDLLRGTGGSAVQGLLNQIPAANVVDFSTSVVTASGANWQTYVNARKLIQRVAKAELLDDAVSPGFAMGHDVQMAFELIKSENNAVGTDNAEVARKVISTVGNPSLANYRFMTSGMLLSSTNSDLIFGDWDQCMVAEFGAMVIATSREADGAFLRRQTVIMAYEDIDLLVMQPDAFAMATNFDTSALAA